MRKITLTEDAYWKLKEAKAKLRCRTWSEFANKVYERVLSDRP